MPSIKQLQYFCALAGEKNMSRLAVKLFVSQTALSNAIARLESELGVSLFLRSQNGLTLSEGGQIYYHYARRVLDLLGEADEELMKLKNKDSRSLSVAFNSPMLYSELLVEFLSQYPDCVVTQQSCNIDLIEAGLPAMPYDLFLAGADDIASGWLDKKVLTSDTIYVCVPNGHRFAGKRSIRLEECKDESFIFQNMSTSFSRFSMRLFSEAGYTPKIAAYCEYSMRGELLKQNRGIILTSDAVRRVNYYDDCVYIPLEPHTTRDMAVFWSKNKPLSDTKKAFIDCASNYFQRRTNREIP